ncbi:MAG: prepilin-type N-terminal cleavage/methylation domain-containing protein [Phycisphaerales bacterium]|nr:MAG: prepilin-type N-terminal cleavage/methylation domain-containing protein [Phycisphaerales bacterium]
MRPRDGFTLVELLVVVLILGTLAVFTIPRIAGSVKSAKVNACKSNVGVMNQQIELYQHNTGSWPNNLKLVTESTEYFPDGPPACPFDDKYKMQTQQGGYRVEEHTH